MAMMGFEEETILEENQLEKLKLRRVKKLKNGKAAGKDEVTEEMVKGGGDVVVDWIWKLCNMAFESDVVPENLRSAVIVPLHKWKNYRGISLLSVVDKI